MFGHSQCSRHPIQKLCVCPEVQIDEFTNCPSAYWAASYPLLIPFWEVNPVIDWLEPQYCESHKKCTCRETINSSWDHNILKGGHLVLGKAIDLLDSGYKNKGGTSQFLKTRKLSEWHIFYSIPYYIFRPKVLFHPNAISIGFYQWYKMTLS